MLRKVSGGISVCIGAMVQKAAERLFEVGVFTSRCVYTSLSCLRRDMSGNIRTEMQNTLAAVI